VIERIDSAVFGPVPDFVRLTVRMRRIHDVTDGAAAAAREALARAGAAAAAAPAPDAMFAAWRTAYADVGLPAATVPPHEALLAWARSPHGVPSQGVVADLLNAFSLTHGVPTAGYDVDHIQGDLWLRPSRGCEAHWPLGGAAGRPTTVEINELILADSADAVVARAWHGAPGAQAFVGAASRDILLHFDLLPPAPAALQGAGVLALEASARIGALLGGPLSWHAMSRAVPMARWDA